MPDPKEKDAQSGGSDLNELNDEGAGLGATSDDNTFEPEEEPEAD